MLNPLLSAYSDNNARKAAGILSLGMARRGRERDTQPTSNTVQIQKDLTHKGKPTFPGES